MKCDLMTVIHAACRVLNIEYAQFIDEHRSPPSLRMARDGVVGAGFELSVQQPTTTELAKASGREHHTTVMDRLERFYRDWPGPLRVFFLNAVREELHHLGVSRIDSPTPSTKSSRE